jgi:hypothetical protein
MDQTLVLSLADYGKFIAEQSAKWNKVARDAKIKSD